MNKSNYQKFLQFAQKLKLQRNTSWRGNCICGGNNSLSVSNENGKLKWYCFRVSCKASGIHSTDISLEDIKTKFREPELKPLQLTDCVGWTQNLGAYPSVIEYLIKNNCMDFYNAWPNKLYYDRIQDRVVFVESLTHNSFSLATGRSISKNVRAVPKWYKYVALPGKYFAAYGCFPSKKDVVYICEDAASAASLARVGIAAVALCGTSYDIYSLILKLNNIACKNVVIILDPDAQLTALKLKTDISGVGNFDTVKVVNLTNDAKYFSYDELNEMLHA